MSSWSRPTVTVPNPPFVPINRPGMRGITIGDHDQPPPPAQLAALQALGVPILCRMPVRNAQDALIQCDSLTGYPNLVALLLIEDITDGPFWSLDHAKCWGVQFGNETDLAPYNWPAERFADRVLAYYAGWRAGGFTKPILSGGIFSPTAKEDNGDWHGHAYLTPLLTRARTAAQDLVIDVHWYLAVTDEWLGRLQALTTGFAVSVSEYGLPSRTPEEDQAQAAYLVDRGRLWDAFGMVVSCVYEANSGADDTDLDHYGLFRLDESVKPGLAVLGERG